MARLILPQGFEGHDFIKMMKHEPHGRNRIRGIVKLREM